MVPRWSLPAITKARSHAGHRAVDDGLQRGLPLALDAADVQLAGRDQPVDQRAVPDGADDRDVPGGGCGTFRDLDALGALGSPLDGRADTGDPLDIVPQIAHRAPHTREVVVAHHEGSGLSLADQCERAGMLGERDVRAVVRRPERSGSGHVERCRVGGAGQTGQGSESAQSQGAGRACPDDRSSARWPGDVPVHETCLRSMTVQRDSRSRPYLGSENSPKQWVVQNENVSILSGMSAQVTAPRRQEPYAPDTRHTTGAQPGTPCRPGTRAPPAATGARTPFLRPRIRTRHPPSPAVHTHRNNYMSWRISPAEPASEPDRDPAPAPA